MQTVDKINEMKEVLKISFIARKLGLSDSGLWKKMTGKAPFTEKEAKEIENLYYLISPLFLPS